MSLPTGVGTDSSGSARTRRPNRAVVFGLLALAGLLAIVSGTQPWWQARANGATVAFTGTDATGGLSQALAVVLLAGTLLGLTLQVIGRRILSVLLGSAAVGAIALAATRRRPDTSAVADRVRQVTLADQFSLSVTGWPWAFLAAGVLALVGAVALGWAAGSWPRRRARFDRTERAAARLVGVDDLGADPAAAWQAQDIGLDPTTAKDPPRGLGSADAPRVDPDVHREPSRDTMGHETQPER